MQQLTETGSVTSAAKPYRRKHSPELKAQVIAECQAPGACITRVAASYGLHDSIVRRWLSKARVTALPGVSPHASSAAQTKRFAVAGNVANGFVPVRLERCDPVAGIESPVIRLQCQRRSTGKELSVTIDWPATDTAGCVQLLRSLLQ